MAQPLSALVILISSVLFDSSKPSSSLLERLLYELFKVFVSCSLMSFFVTSMNVSIVWCIFKNPMFVFAFKSMFFFG